MLKKIMFTGILIISIAVLNAKNVIEANPIFQNSSGLQTYDALVNKIAADNDFKNYYISNVKFANKIIGTGAG
ncbi:MAG: hypothetical protein ABIN74_13960, partial [Ferruginibacter sp.]